MTTVLKTKKLVLHGSFTYHAETTMDPVQAEADLTKALQSLGFPNLHMSVEVVDEEDA